MSEAVLTVLKFCFLALLYLFLYRVVRLTLRELRAPALTAEPAGAPTVAPPRRARPPRRPRRGPTPPRSPAPWAPGASWSPPRAGARRTPSTARSRSDGAAGAR